MARARFSRVFAGAALALSLSLGAPKLAWADAAAAEQLFQQGLEAMERRDYDVACEAFAGSNKADPSPGTQINLALCFERQKKWASAWTWYRSAFGLAQQRGQSEREKLAEAAASRLKPQLHYIVISAADPAPGMTVRRDGAEVTIAIAGKAVPLPVDPGEHTIEVSAPGKLPWTKVITVADDAETDRIEVPSLADAPSTAVSPDASASGGTVVVTSDGSTQRTLGIVAGGAGLLAGISSIGVFILASSVDDEGKRLRDDEKAATNDVDRAEYARTAKSKESAADMNRIIALSLAGGGAVLVGVGAVLYFTAPSAPKTSAAKTQVVPLLGPGFGGLGVGGTF